MSELPQRYVDRFFVDEDGAPRLFPCAVLFIDLLGVRAMNQSPEVDQHLRDLDRAVSAMYRDFLAANSPWPASFFSDTLVLTAPIVPSGDEESAIGSLLVQAAWLQINLIEAGFFARGGLSIGRMHLRDGLVFGPALVDAYHLESNQADHPRIVLGEEVVRSQSRDLDFYASPADSPQNALLLRDADGHVFVNYLGLVLDDPTESAHDALEIHRDAVMHQLSSHRVDRRVWEKYRWVAEYHNWTCAQRIPEPGDLLIPSAATTWSFSSFA